MTRTLTQEEKIEYDRLTKEAEQIRLKLDVLENKPVVYGYARVSSKGQVRDGNSLEKQNEDLKAAGAEVIYSDVYTGTTTDRPELDKLLSELKSGDTIVVTKMDRIARSVLQGIELIDNLMDKGVTVHVLNLGTMDNQTPTGRLLRNTLLAFAEFERDMILQRTREGREVARTKEGYKEGRPPKFKHEQIEHALELLKSNSYEMVCNMTGISKSTLIRAKRKSESTEGKDNEQIT